MKTDPVSILIYDFWVLSIHVRVSRISHLGIHVLVSRI